MSIILNTQMFRILTMSTLQARIAESLRRAKLKPIDLARQAGVTRGTVSQWVNGPTKTIEGDNLMRAARALNEDPHWLATGERKHLPTQFGTAEPAAIYVGNEHQLLQKFRGLGEDDKLRALAIIEALAKTAAARKPR